MKKIIVALLVLLISFSLFATDYRVSVYPENEQLENLITTTFSTIYIENEEIPVNLVKTTTPLKEKYLFSFDIQYLDMICDKDNTNLLLITKQEDEKSILFAYERSSEELTQVTSVKSMEDDSFEVLFSLISFFPLPETENIITSKPIVVLTENPIYVNCTNTVADVYLNGEKVGQTPYTVQEYSLPFTLEFKADGYSSRIVNVNDFGKDIVVDLKVVSMDTVEQYKKSKTKFYQAFSNSLILFGIQAAARSIIPKDNKAYKPTNIVLESLLAGSVIDTGYRLFKYYKNGQKLVP